MRAAASRTFCTAGSSRPIRTAMMAMTTSSSISVNAADRLALASDMRHPPEREKIKALGRGWRPGCSFGEVEVIGPRGRRFHDFDRQAGGVNAGVLRVGEPPGLPGEVADVHRLG